MSETTYLQRHMVSWDIDTIYTKWIRCATTVLKLLFWNSDFTTFLVITKNSLIALFLLALKLDEIQTKNALKFSIKEHNKFCSCNLVVS